ncbi:MAG: cupin domain-containing protein [Bacteroidetes bacterium]|nr:MAG: cupin domain-containing protein [Bacteroidota bacterium]
MKTQDIISTEVGPVAPDRYTYRETQELTRLVEDAVGLLRLKGEAAFDDFGQMGSKWRQNESYIFVLDLDGNMLVHPDPALKGKNTMYLKDVNGKAIIQGLLETVTALSDKHEGWYHYQWPVPGGLLPRWKSTYVQLVQAPSGRKYMVGSGVYNDRMERTFVEDLVRHAVGEVERKGKAAFKAFHDPAGPFLVKDVYIFVVDMNGVELVNPAFPYLEGRKLLEMKDANGKYVFREMIRMVQKDGAGWLDYMWPKPGESVASQKSSYVHMAKMGDRQVMVGCGVYPVDAVTEPLPTPKTTAPELKALVLEAAALLETDGANAFPSFRQKGSRWFHEDTYLFVFDMKGQRVFHAAEPETEGRMDIDLRDVLDRPIVRMILDVGLTPKGEGWVHYLYPEPGNLFPTWKSSFVKRVCFPSGETYMVGCGIYNLQMNKTFIEDLVQRAAALIAERGKSAFDLLRDKTGPFVFMDTYVFVQDKNGIELVNPGFPSLEGRNLIDMKDLEGRSVIREEIAAAMTEGSAWVELQWFKPGDNTPALKQTYVQKVQHKGETYIVGSGVYGLEGTAGLFGIHAARKIHWQDIKEEKMTARLSRQMVHGEKSTVSRFRIKAGATAARHYHANEEYAIVLSGTVKFIFDDRETVVSQGEVLVIAPNVPHAIEAMSDAEMLDIFTPVREDWLRGEDLYMRK